MQTISKQTFDAERALYALRDASVQDCVFAGPADGESALKESRDVTVERCRFSLRYPLWHAHDFRLLDSGMDALTRAPIWYARGGLIAGCDIEGVKCLRECDEMELRRCRVRSAEFGWRCRGVRISDCEMESEYFLFQCRDVTIDRLKMKGKYSFQYVEGMSIASSELDTKDAFWHSVGVTVRDSTIRGEYLGWYSDGLTLINCHIEGTQPLCYCKRLTLINCTMSGTDLAFEYSDVQADIRGNIVSVKNPRSGRIAADSIGEMIREQSVMATDCEVTVRS